MKNKRIKIYAQSDPDIALRIFPGHFATPQSHITHYMDMTTMKARVSEAMRIAKALSKNYEVSTPVDTIVCMDGLQVVGAFLADELTKSGVLSMNAHKTIYVIAPEFNSVGQMIFRDNLQPMIKQKNILLLNGSITTGETLHREVESVLYYGGIIQGVAAVFSAVTKVAGLEVRSIFQQKDLPEYGSYKSSECPMCKRKEKLDAIVNGYGYSEI